MKQWVVKQTKKEFGVSTPVSLTLSKSGCFYSVWEHTCMICQEPLDLASVALDIDVGVFNKLSSMAL